MKANYTLVRKINQDKRKKDDAPLVIFLRPLADLLTIPLVNWNVSANTITFINFFIAIFALLLIAVSKNNMVLGFSLLIIWQLFDIIDGNIARVSKNISKIGGLVDHLIGLHIIAFLPFALGVSTFYENQNPVIFENYKLNIGFIAIILGGFSSIICLLLRLIHLSTVDFLGGNPMASYQIGGFRENSKKIISLRILIIYLLRQLESVGGLQILVWIIFLCFDMVILGLILYTILVLIIYFAYILKLLKNKP